MSVVARNTFLFGGLADDAKCDFPTFTRVHDGVSATRISAIAPPRRPGQHLAKLRGLPMLSLARDRPQFDHNRLAIDAYVLDFCSRKKHFLFGLLGPC